MRKRLTSCCASPLKTQRDYGSKPQDFTEEELQKVSRKIVSSTSEKEVERLISDIIPKTEYRGKVFTVGGFLRDELLGIDSKDLDIVVEMKGGAEKITHFIKKLFPNSVSNPYNLGNYPIWSIIFTDNVVYEEKEYKTKGAVIEFADSQKETFPDKDSRQRITEFGTIQDDVDRRDLTINALLRDLTTGEIKDLTGMSVNDIKNGIIRGSPRVDFGKILQEDPLRMLRVVRLYAKFDFKIPMSVLRDIKTNAERIKIVSEERIRDELTKMMKTGRFYKAVRLMKAVGLLKHILPEIEDTFGVDHDTSRGYHQEKSVWNHILLVLKNAKPDVESQLAALLHDVGKPATRKQLGEKIQFIGHEVVGAEIAEMIMRRLRFDLDTIKRVRALVRNHMLPHQFSRNDFSEKSLRKFIRNIGDELLDALLDLAEADTKGNLPPKEYVPWFREKIKEIKEKAPVSKKPILNGHEIIEITDLRGVEIGRAIEFLKDKADEYASAGKAFDKEEAKKLVIQYAKQEKRNGHEMDGDQKHQP